MAESTQTRIEQAALARFFRDGYNGASLRDILDDADAKMSSLYHHFGSKQGVLYAVLKRTSEDSLGLLEERLDGVTGPVERLRTAIQAHIEWHTARQREAFVADAELARLEDPHRAEVVELRNRHERVFRDIIDAGVADGTFRPVESALVTRLILTAATGVSGWYRPAGGHGPATISAIFSDALVDGLRVR